MSVRNYILPVAEIGDRSRRWSASAVMPTPQVCETFASAWQGQQFKIKDSTQHTSEEDNVNSLPFVRF